MIISNRSKNQHLLWRAAFGPMAEQTASLDNISQKDLWELLLKTSAAQPVKLAVTANPAEGLYKDVKDMKGVQDALNNKEKRQMFRQQSREDIKKLNIKWLDTIVNSESQLREKMSLFWHGHFACRIPNSYFQQELLHTVRTNALGNFGTMLKEVSKSPAMLQFLNNQQNRKSHPNENFAREVMELFTMGRGNYTENDVKEAARAFTGWGFNLQGQFVFRRQQHDDADKTFLGKTGNFNGDDILDMLLAQKQTAEYITRKLFRWLVNEKIDEQKCQWLSSRFYQNNYDIRKLLGDIFMSDWFYDEKNIGTRIKSPVELLAGIRRLLPLELDNDESQLLFQRVLGQVLFFPPNVAGWPGGKNWIDSSTLMLRLQIPQVFSAKESISIRPKADDDVNMGQMQEEQVRIKRNQAYTKRGATASINWDPVIKIFESTKRESLLQKISDTVLQTGSRVPDSILNNYVNAESRENFIKSAVINLMSTPEYQLC